jgi:hypothetical protein
MFAIQAAQSCQFSAIADLNVESYREYADRLTAEAWAVLQSRLREVDTAAQRAVFLVALKDQDLAGSVAYCPAGKSTDPIPVDWASRRCIIEG